MGVLRRDPPSDSAMDVHDVHTILGPESSFEGKLMFDGTVRIDGKFKGEVHTEGSLVVGHGARLEANVFVGHLVVHGEVVGDITATQAVEVHAPAKVQGNITTPQLLVAKGVVFDGTCKMTEQQAEAQNVTHLNRGTGSGSGAKD